MRHMVDEVVRPVPGMRLLDFGCGNGRLVPFVEGVEYVGVDNNPSYIDSATEQYGGPTTRFICADLNDLADMGIESVDVVVCIGVLHHLDDTIAARALEASAHLLKADGRLITMDPCFEPSQHSLARVLMALDRGKYVRHPEGYRNLLHKNFEIESERLWTHVYKFPYTHFVTESKPAAPRGVNSATDGM